MSVKSDPDKHRAEHRDDQSQLVKRGPGQPKYLIPQNQIEKVIEACVSGASEVSIARALKINYRTWARVRTDDERIASALQEAKKIEEDELSSLLLDKARNGDTTSLIFALKSRHDYRDHGAPTGLNAHPVNIQIINLPAAADSMEDYVTTIEGKSS